MTRDPVLTALLASAATSLAGGAGTFLVLTTRAFNAGEALPEPRVWAEIGGRTAPTANDLLVTAVSRGALVLLACTGVAFALVAIALLRQMIMDTNPPAHRIGMAPPMSAAA